MGKPVKLFIVEGENRDFRFIERMTKQFFSRGKFESKIINVPAAQNIYMLYNTLVKDNFETDLIEVLRDSVDTAREKLEGIRRQDVDEIFLFFDYDVHQNNLGHNNSSDDVLKQMLDFFQDETDNGKLYISYPMVEALYDYRDAECESYSSCFIGFDEICNYKRLSGEENSKASSSIEIDDWQMILKIFVLRIKCMLEVENLDFDVYRSKVTPSSIYSVQKTYKDRVFVLSAFPEFLFDYFPVKFWKSHASLKNFQFNFCAKNRKPKYYNNKI